MDEMENLAELHLASNRLSGIPHSFARLKKVCDHLIARINTV